MSWRAICGDCRWRGDAGARETADRQAWQHEVHHWVAASCEASGVPLRVQDPIAIRKIAVLLGGVSASQNRLGV